MRSVIAAFRLLRVSFHILRGAWTIRFVFPDLDAERREAQVQVWANRMLNLLGITLRPDGKPVRKGPVLLAANHISWLDIVVIHATGHCRFVSKSEVRQWPLVGLLAEGAGTLFLERTSRKDAMRVVHHMVECLQAGEILAIFPEGTTGDGQSVLPFHANLLQAAVSADVPIQPVALSFVDPLTGSTSFAPCYIGEDTLMQSLWRTLKTPALLAVVRFGEPQWAEGRDRRAWAVALRQSVEDLRL